MYYLFDLLVKVKLGNFHDKRPKCNGGWLWSMLYLIGLRFQSIRLPEEESPDFDSTSRKHTYCFVFPENGLFRNGAEYCI